VRPTVHFRMLYAAPAMPEATSSITAPRHFRRWKRATRTMTGMMY
jgi:hypothetical protein